jgi:hypothetical protein
MTEASTETFTAQVGYAAKNWGAAVAYSFGQNVGFAETPQVGGTVFGDENIVANRVAAINSIGLSAYWQPETAGGSPRSALVGGLPSTAPLGVATLSSTLAIPQIKMLPPSPGPWVCSGLMPS